MVSIERTSSKKITGMPASRSWSWTSVGPMVASVSTTLGSSERIASAWRSCAPGVTTGRSAASGKPVEVSRPTTFSPSPREKTISASVPWRSTARMRVEAVLVAGDGGGRHGRQSSRGGAPGAVGERLAVGVVGDGDALDGLAAGEDGLADGRGILVDGFLLVGARARGARAVRRRAGPARDERDAREGGEDCEARGET